MRRHLVMEGRMDEMLQETLANLWINRKEIA
jgi:hypothetical protein